LGWGFFVKLRSYLEEVARHANQEEISHCVGFSAIWNANNKKTKGLQATGISGVICTCYELIQPNGIRDLQVREQYVNMDYIFLLSLLGMNLKHIIVSYDIACQWGKSFLDQMEQMPYPLQLPSDKKLTFKVSKFHLPAHVPKCFTPYALNFTEGVGHADREGIERVWSIENEIVHSVVMMVAGGCWDTMDDHFNHHN
ncbi:hypothetical protein Moror_15543, partial [Moniliophthora roreri MCA 2997]